MKKLLVVVDYQNDFVSGSLGFPGAEGLEPGLAACVQNFLQAGHFVLFTRDTHQDTYLDTREGQYLPIVHCQQGSVGHQLYGTLHLYETAAHPHTLVLDKPTFGAMQIGDEAAALCEGPPDEISLCGLVTDICVISNAILLQTSFPSAKISILSSLCGSGNALGAAAAFTVMKGLGMEILETP